MVARRRAGVLALAAVAGACGRARSDQVPPAAPPVEAVTFNRDIAPVVYRNCAPCHRPGEAGPFSLLSYADVRKRADQIARVTGRRYMPPWPPEPGYGEFAGERRLKPEEIALLQRWAHQGAPETPPADAPAPPCFTEGWQLGSPDLVVEMRETYTVPAEGGDVFRNFVLPVPIKGTRYVRALELRPGDKKVVHHANVLLDSTGSARRLDERDPGVGFAGMDVELESDRFEPDSHFLFWKPGTAAVTEPPGMAWRLDEGTDLVLNMHLQPTGKPERIRPMVGLYFTDEAPTKFPMLLQLEQDGAIDIPPGERQFVVGDHYDLPVDVEVLGVYPHAHYVGREVQAFAMLPDGTKRWLIWIRDWDFAWQAVYRFAHPVFLPRGSRLEMRITYDNSADNVRNPSDPPRRVVAGNRSTDEMGHLWIQVLPRQRDDRWTLQETFMRRRLEKYPGDFVAHANLAAALEQRGRGEEAIAEYRQALRARPDSAAVLNNLGAALQASGRLDEAIHCYRAAARAQPDYLNARHNLGGALVQKGAFAEALPYLREAVRARPDDSTARNNLGGALLATGRLDEAILELRRAAEIDPRSLNAHYNLGRALAARAGGPRPSSTWSRPSASLPVIPMRARRSPS
jgi:Flp pilus assembly protein TadD/mono/diheme cytochrome c family protein